MPPQMIIYTVRGGENRSASTKSAREELLGGVPSSSSSSFTDYYRATSGRGRGGSPAAELNSTARLSVCLYGHEKCVFIIDSRMTHVEYFHIRNYPHLYARKISRPEIIRLVFVCRGGGGEALLRNNRLIYYLSSA